MSTKLELEILPQPDDTTCGPTCLTAIYHYYNDLIPLSQVISEVTKLEHGGTIAVFLACHALRRGYDAQIFTYNLHVFDPTWFKDEGAVPDISKRLQEQAWAKNKINLQTATSGYLDFLQLGGKLAFKELTANLIRRFLKQSIPILTGLSSTYLYRSMREFGGEGHESDIKGEPAGHFVILSGYDKETRNVYIADPLLPNPVASNQYYEVTIDRVIGAILLGVLTHDANFLIIRPKPGKRDKL